MIRQVSDISDVMPLLTVKCKNSDGLCLKDFLEWTHYNLLDISLERDHDFKILVDYENETLKGFVIFSSTLSKIKHLSEVRIHRLWYDGEDTMKQFMDILTDWAKANRIKNIRLQADKVPEFEGWGFSITSHNMVKEI